jgi:phosphate transport system protein
MKDHTVTAFDIELKQLADSVLDMGRLARQSCTLAAASLSERGPGLAGEVKAIDAQVDGLQRTIEEAGILLIARRQPVAFDLREVVCALRIANDLERIGDLASNIAQRAAVLESTAAPQPLTAGLESLSVLVIERLDEALEIFTQRNAARAAEIWASDVSVDDLYTSIFRGILTYMMEDPRHISACAQLVFVGKNLERIGDHVSNIAESVYYAATGEQLDETRRTGERSAEVEAITAG